LCIVDTTKHNIIDDKNLFAQGDTFGIDVGYVIKELKEPEDDGTVFFSFGISVYEKGSTQAIALAQFSYRGNDNEFRLGLFKESL
jgi:hypothetical protein